MKKIYNTLLLCAGLSIFPLLASGSLSEKQINKEQASEQHSIEQSSPQKQSSQKQSPKEQASQALIDKIEQAITFYEQTARDQWSFQISNYENEEGDVSSSIEKFDPTRQTNKQWTLLSINGESPTEKQQQEFVEGKLKRAEEKAAKKKKDSNEQSFSLQFRELIQLESLEFVSETDGKILANFSVYLKKLGEDASSKLQGQLTYNEQEKFIEHIEITNKDSFSPVFSAKITDFKITFDFAKVNHAILPQEYQLNMKGTFAFFTEIEEISTNTFSDYRYVGE